MNPIGLSFLDGSALFARLTLVGVAGALFIRFGTGFLRPFLTLLLLAGLAAVLLSAVPLPGWLYLIWILPAGAILIFGNWPGASALLRFHAFAVLFAATLVILLAEGPRQRSPRIPVEAGQTLYVAGDSISAGLNTGERCWPEVLAAATSLRVVNLAEPGATVESALAQLRKIAKPGALVLLEIGGNDLLDRTAPSVFETRLAKLVSALRAVDHRILMFELPLFPFQNAYGQAQRSVAIRCQIPLFPRRHFARVLGLKDGTLDGLHLTQKGHDEMARRVASLLRIEGASQKGPTQ